MTHDLFEMLSDLGDGFQRSRVFEKQVHGAHVVLLAGDMEGSEAILKDRHNQICKVFTFVYQQQQQQKLQQNNHNQEQEY